MISVIGLGKLGLPFALTLASKGNEVYGIDLNTTLIKKLQNGSSNLYEPQIANHLTQYRNTIHFSTNVVEAITNTNITFIIVPTLSEPDGSFSLKYIHMAIKMIAPVLKKKKSKHTIVITSTVSPLSMEKIGKSLKIQTGKGIGNDIGLCYSPEFIALGSVVHNLINPDLILIGESDSDSGKQLLKLRKSICENNPTIVRTNWINAELTKISLNSYITMKISFANMIARVCERIPGADVDIITQAIGSDKRVGNKFLKGGLGFGGPCFPRDNVAISTFIHGIDLDAEIPSAVQAFNLSQLSEIFSFIKKHIGKKTLIGILGLSYKPETDVIDESQGILLAKKFITEGYNVKAYDPAAMSNAKIILPDVGFTSSAQECIDVSEVIVITTPWPQFIDLNWLTTKNKNSRKIVIDCWRLLDKSKLKSEYISYIPLGSKPI